MGTFHAFIVRGEGPDSWSWEIDEDWRTEVDSGTDWAGSIGIPYDPESDLYDICSGTLFAALEAEGFDTSAHWFYTDGDYGLIGEWNRPEEG
jgi:hypothetical protein